MHFIYGLIGMVIGGAMVIYADALLNTFGRMDFFDRFLGTFGGTRLGYKLIGLIVFFLSLIMFIGLFDNFMYWVLGPLLGPAQRTF